MGVAYEKLCDQLASVIYDFLAYEPGRMADNSDAEGYAESCHRARNVLAVHEATKALQEMMGEVPT
jgi:hypothetical protein